MEISHLLLIFLIISVSFFFFSDSLEGYVHLLSRVTNSKKNPRVSYFDCHIQTSENERVRAVCYSPEKRINLNQAFKNKSPVKIQGVKRTASKRFHATMEEYTIAKQAKIMPSSPTFEYNEQFASKLCTVTEALAKDIYETVDLKVKILTKEENKQPIIQNEKVRYKCDTVIGDNTNSMKLVIWKNIIDDVHAGKSYHLINLKVHVFEDEKCLNTMT